MHRYILKAPNGYCVDHINGNPLDNRMTNLRVCNKGENNRNSKKQINNKSGFKGVHKEKRWGKWVAQINFNNKKIWLGQYETPEKAYEAYKKGALKHHGEFARFN